MNGAEPAQLLGIEAAVDDRDEVDVAAPGPERAQADGPDHIETLHAARQLAVQASQEIVDSRGRRRRKPTRALVG
jgi:hypothetical protein